MNGPRPRRRPPRRLFPRPRQLLHPHLIRHPAFIAKVLEYAGIASQVIAVTAMEGEVHLVLLQIVWVENARNAVDWATYHTWEEAPMVWNTRKGSVHTATEQEIANGAKEEAKSSADIVMAAENALLVMERFNVNIVKARAKRNK